MSHFKAINILDINSLNFYIANIEIYCNIHIHSNQYLLDFEATKIFDYYFEKKKKEKKVKHLARTENRSIRIGFFKIPLYYQIIFLFLSV